MSLFADIRRTPSDRTFWLPLRIQPPLRDARCRPCADLPLPAAVLYNSSFNATADFFTYMSWSGDTLE